MIFSKRNYYVLIEMIRILALNEESHSSGSEDDKEPTVTKEAQVISFKINSTKAQKFHCPLLCTGNNSSVRICSSAQIENRQLQR